MYNYEKCIYHVNMHDISTAHVYDNKWVRKKKKKVELRGNVHWQCQVYYMFTFWYDNWDGRSMLKKQKDSELMFWRILLTNAKKKTTN